MFKKVRALFSFSSNPAYQRLGRTHKGQEGVSGLAVGTQARQAGEEEGAGGDRVLIMGLHGIAEGEKREEAKKTQGDDCTWT